MTLDLSPRPDFELDSKIDRINFGWNQAEMAQVPVLAQAPRPCAVENVHIPVTSAYLMPSWKPNGDTDFEGRVDIQVTVTLLQNPNYINGQIYMLATGTPNKDDTVAEGTTPEFRVYTAPPGKEIVTIAAPITETMRTVDLDVADDKIAGTGGIANNYVVRGVRDGVDAGVYTDVTVHFNPFVVQLIETEACV